MSNLLALLQIPPAVPFTNYYTIPSGTTAEELASQLGLTADQWAEFDIADFPGCEPWNTCFTLVNNQPSPNTVTFDLAAAKLAADDLVKQKSVTVQQTLLDGYTAEQIAAQAALAAISRDVRFQTIINDLNVESADTLQRQADIAAATTIAEVNAIVFP
jgi:hypothetical protein